MAVAYLSLQISLAVVLYSPQNASKTTSTVRKVKQKSLAKVCQVKGQGAKGALQLFVRDAWSKVFPPKHLEYTGERAAGGRRHKQSYYKPGPERVSPRRSALVFGLWTRQRWTGRFDPRTGTSAAGPRLFNVG